MCDGRDNDLKFSNKKLLPEKKNENKKEEKLWDLLLGMNEYRSPYSPTYLYHHKFYFVCSLFLLLLYVVEQQLKKISR